MQSSPQAIITKIESALTAAGGFVVDVNAESASFNIRKPVRYPDQILHRNRMIVNGKIRHQSTENVSDVEISFSQDFYMKMTVFSMVVFAGILIALISKASSGAIMYLLGALVLIVGVVMWMALQKKLEKDALRYKELVGEILGSA